ncbi:hypothetical protein LCGC14_2847500 [marine sediment metagenome]|uniref:Non-reducing end beta-L-arabinofuranosidase-like GH127 middle domain-containing protein n=1 Tax=marine sediment metagenome TaxID=412755 RepID=A0A0F8YW46_9ZZZZ
MTIEPGTPKRGTPKPGTLKPAAPKPFNLALRIPGWSTQTEVSVGGQPVSGVEPGEYLELTRDWNPREQIVLRLDMSVRYEPGDLEQYGKVSLYRGPILLALDDRFHSGAAPTIEPAKLSAAKLIAVRGELARAAGPYQPWLVVETPTADDGTVRLIDFASAGATTVEGQPSSSYLSWLPAVHLPPPLPVAWHPADRSKIGPGRIPFAWRRGAVQAAASRKHTIVISDSPSFERVVIEYGEKVGNWLARNPRVHFHFVPTGACWANLVERLFGELDERQLKRLAVHSVPELVHAIDAYLEHRNQDPTPFVWTKSAQEILDKIHRGLMTLATLH